MDTNLYLLGGSGRIGTALVKSLIDTPLVNLDSIYIYCDSTKVPRLNSYYECVREPSIGISGYSSFNRFIFEKNSRDSDGKLFRNVVVNLRGVNNKQQWLNQPLDALNLHINSCKTLIDSDLWMHPHSEIIHLSSQLCNLIESNETLDEMCEGQESYRRPYMVSRLHQEMLLSANAYQHSLTTTFFRLPAIYGFNDDEESPWILNALCKEKLLYNAITPRNPGHLVSLSHHRPFIESLRALIASPGSNAKLRTVNYANPSMISLSVQALADLIQLCPGSLSIKQLQSFNIILDGDQELSNTSLLEHVNLLISSIAHALSTSLDTN